MCAVSAGTSVWSVAAGGGMFSRIERRLTDQTADWYNTAVHWETAHLTSDCCFVYCTSSLFAGVTTCLGILESQWLGNVEEFVPKKSRKSRWASYATEMVSFGVYVAITGLKQSCKCCVSMLNFAHFADANLEHGLLEYSEDEKQWHVKKVSDVECSYRSSMYLLDYILHVEVSERREM